MKNRLHRLRRSLLSGALLAAALLALPGVASARSTISELRVEVPGARALAPGHWFVNGTGLFRTDTRPACAGSGQLKTVTDPSALGILAFGSRVDRDLRPVGASDQFDFGLFVCGIGEFVTDNATRFWLFKVNHVSPQVGGDQVQLARGDKVLWYMQDTARGSNVGNELELRGPARARPGEPVTLEAVEYDYEGKSKPAAGVLVRGAGPGALTDAGGRLTTTLGAGRVPLRAYRKGDIPSELIKVCVNADLGSCPAVRGEVIYGTAQGDTIKGTRGADLVISGNGDDRIDVRGGEADRVRCGRGFDRVLASPNDKVRRSCNKVVRRG